MSFQESWKIINKKVNVRVETLFFPSESKSRILEGISAILDPTHPSYRIKEVIRERNKWLIASGKSFHVLAPIYFALRKNRILDTARKILKSQLNQAEDDSTPDEIVIHFNKQHASSGKIHLSPPSGESPLGAIHLFLSSSNLPYLIDWLTPRTQRGKPIENLPPRL